MNFADTAVTIGTLIIGAALTQVTTNVGERKAARALARELLAESPRFIWDRASEDAAVELQIYLARLGNKLRAARVPFRVVRAHEIAATRFWHGVERAPEEVGGGWSISMDVSEQYDDFAELIGLYLDERALTRRFTARREARPLLQTVDSMPPPNYRRRVIRERWGAGTAGGGARR